MLERQFYGQRAGVRGSFSRECCFSLEETACVDEVWVNWGIILHTGTPMNKGSSLDIYMCISSTLHCWCIISA